MGHNTSQKFFCQTFADYSSYSYNKFKQLHALHRQSTRFSWRSIFESLIKNISLVINLKKITIYKFTNSKIRQWFLFCFNKIRQKGWGSMDPVWTNLIQSDPIWSKMNKFDPKLTSLIKFDKKLNFPSFWTKISRTWKSKKTTELGLGLPAQNSQLKIVRAVCYHLIQRLTLQRYLMKVLKIWKKYWANFSLWIVPYLHFSCL